VALGDLTDASGRVCPVLDALDVLPDFLGHARSYTNLIGEIAFSRAQV